MRYRASVIGLAVLVALALQVGELWAFGSPVEQPPPLRPMAPSSDANEDKPKPNGHSRSENEATQIEQVLIQSIQPVLNDGAPWRVWAVVWESE